MPVTTRIVASDMPANTYTFTIEHEGHSLTLGPADAHELANQMEVRLRELVDQLNVAGRIESDLLNKIAAPHPTATGEAAPPEGDAPSGGAPAHCPGEGQPPSSGESGGRGR